MRRSIVRSFGFALLVLSLMSMPRVIADDASVDSTERRNESTATQSVCEPEKESNDSATSKLLENPTETIDQLIEARWNENAETIVSSVCSDETFVRRIYLDLVGRIPTPVERTDFLQDESDGKRSELVDRLIMADEFGVHMADVFDATLMGRTDARRMKRRRDWRSYLAESFNANRPWDTMAKEMLLARKTDDTDVRAGWFLYERRNDHQAIAEAVAPNFFGIRIDCAQCHDHPLCGEIMQGHYWGLVAFFNRGKNEDTKSGPRVVESAIGGFSKFTDLSGDSFDALLTFYESQQVEESRPEVEQKDADELYQQTSSEEPRVPKFSRRQRFVEEVLATHPLLAKSFVNRIWAIMLGRGIVHPVNEMDSMHPASHPDLLDALAEDFQASKFDVKRLVRNIVASKCYQLDSKTIQTARDDLFTHAIEKPLTAESLLRSLNVAATGQAGKLDEDLLSDFRKCFPDVLAETANSKASQALYLTNNPTFQKMIYDESPTVTRLLQISDLRERIQRAFEIVFGRDATDAEFEFATNYVETSHREPRKAMEDLFWAMLTGAEFRFNH